MADQDTVQTKRPKNRAPAGDALPEAEIEAIIRGDHGNPFGVLGLHETPAGLVLRAFIPDARRVWAIDRNTGEIQRFQLFHQRQDAGQILRVALGFFRRQGQPGQPGHMLNGFLRNGHDNRGPAAPRGGTSAHT